MAEVDDGQDLQRTPSEIVYRGILRGLYEGRFGPGQRLAAPDLMREFGVGRGTIREILQRLASTGVVTIRPHKGAQVRRLSRSGVLGVLDVVEVLLGLAARGAAAAGTGLKAELERRYDDMRAIDAELDFNRFVDAREEYYRLLVAAPQNLELQRVFPTIQVQLMRLQLRSFDRAADSVDMGDYSELNEAVLASDPVRADRAGRRHVARTRERVIGLPARAFEPEEPGPVGRPHLAER